MPPARKLTCEEPNMSTAGVVSAAGVAAYILFLARPTTEAWYPWHPALMAAGTLFLMTLAIHIMRRGNPAPYRQKVWNHFLCNAAAAVLVAGGFIAIYFSKAERNKEHFTTWHGQVGLAVTIGIVGQATGSSLLLLSPETLHRLLGVKGTKQFKTMHRYGALVVYLATFSEIFLSFYTNWWNRLVGRETWALFSALTAFTLLTVVVQVLRLVRPESK